MALDRGRGIVDVEGLGRADVQALARRETPAGLPFAVRKIGHVVLKVRDVARSAAFYTDVLGFRVSDVYPESMMPGGMAFMRCNADHHGVALVGGREQDADNSELDHLAFEVATLDEVLRARDHLEKHGVPIDFHGRRRAGCQIAVEFRDPDNHRLEIYWGLDQIGNPGHIRPSDEWREAQSLEEAVENPPPGQDTTLHDPSLKRP
ncbi:MAG: VOC family protein [Defluviicoccus sp.]|nr:VOC family protein [Defluviicoccus sp.]MDE0386365.1 VOC family protein [Defluviicoccus sp.]